MPMRWCSGARSWLGARIVALDHWGGWSWDPLQRSKSESKGGHPGHP